MEPNYRHYSTEELEDVFEHIDSEQYPERYHAVRQRLLQRYSPMSNTPPVDADAPPSPPASGQTTYEHEAVPDCVDIDLALLKPVENNQQPLGVFPYLLSGIGFIPLLGIPFAVIALIWGLLTSRPGGKRLALIGLVALLSTNGYLYLVLHKTNISGNDNEQRQTQQLQDNLNTLYSQVELYRFRHGEYPPSLPALRQAFPLSKVSLQDTSFKNSQEDFYYQRLDSEHYQLLARGDDGKPLTGDDILPATDRNINDVSGLLPKSASSAEGATAAQ
ncbi:hypothetical protein KDN34_03890 [Shewanella yunxiaonensis]|uniref:Type II secretion system protein GspG C-terminal domain-containing protein n=1 Tax=Shewanella yunxiaonensis TaxID=2829809 RepID=A0ABX7YWE6_9GAMM|nr:hypothetical protein [Shewanella yunxiaonensis]QUN06604.1 hypothetical protein KDN34_03890 [Shewanella yunxiaonensis]